MSSKLQQSIKPGASAGAGASGCQRRERNVPCSRWSRFSLSPALALALALGVTACNKAIVDVDTNKPPVTPTDTTTPPPALTREFRGLWVATVSNIDWPSKPGLTADQQKAELTSLFDRAVKAGINTIIFHVRPSANAVYSSSIEPWGEMLTGTQGVSPGYDPLQFAIDEAHARGLELHAWVNPFRAGNSKDTLKLAASQVWNTHRSWVRVYGSQLWLDPGEPAAQDHSMRVIDDIVSRYDIDGLHIDDYFYPYVENNLDFPDNATFAQYANGMARADWRRDNINRFIQRMYSEVHGLKPTLKIGISPFGIWRPGNPPGIVGLDAYSEIYADSKKWLNNGWMDYFAPQLYWSIASTGQSYPALLDWWISQNTTGRLIVPGLAAYRVNDGSSTAFSSSEIPNQIALTRTRTGAHGEILYNATSTLNKLGILYNDVALSPVMPWLDSAAPPAPTLTAGTFSITINPGSGEAARWWAIRTHTTTGWSTHIQFGTNRVYALDSNTDRVVVQAVDQAGNLSSATEWKR